MILIHLLKGFFIKGTFFLILYYTNYFILCYNINDLGGIVYDD